MVTIQTSDGRRIPITVKLAATDEARGVIGTFHMRNVRASLDIAFGKESGRIFSILRMHPSPVTEYGPMGTFRYAIEARAGFFNETGILVGNSLVLEPSKSR
jgi:uncharacterized membrane protein (UPF0127 family)